MINYDKLIGHNKLEAGSAYGGQAAASFTDGLMKGYGFVDKAFAAEQEARAKEERIKTAVTKNKLLDIAYNDVASDTTQETKMQSMEQEIQVMKKERDQSNGVAVSADLNGLAVQHTIDERSDYLTGVREKIVSNPSMYKALGIKDPTSMTVLNNKDKEDMKWMTTFLNAQGVSPEELDLDTTTPEGKKAWDEVLQESVNLYPVVKVDGAPVDLIGLGAASGAYSQASPKMRKQMEENQGLRFDKLEEIVQRGRLDEEAPKEVSTPTITEDVAEEGGKMVEPVEEKANTPWTPIKADKYGVGNGEMTFKADQGFIFTDENGNTKVVKATDKVDTWQEALVIANKQATSDTETTGRANSTSMKDVTAVMDGHETGGTKSYTAVNPKSGAYGRYQFMPDTMKALQKKLGLPLTSEPNKEQQDAMYKTLVKEHQGNLAGIGKEATAENLYIMHQLGGPVGKKYLTGDIDSKVISSMKNQFSPQATEGKSNKEIQTMWEARFASGDTQSNATSSIVSNEVSKQGGTAPLSDMRMRKVYALLGATYPKDPNAPTAKMKNFDFLTQHGLSDDEALNAVWGSNKTTLRKSPYGKMVQERQDAVNSGDTELVKQYDELMKNTIDSKGATKTKVQYDRARQANKDLVIVGKDNWTADQQADYNSNLEVIEGYEDTASIQTSNDKLEMRKGAHELSSQHANEIEKSYKDGTKISAKAKADLREAQSMLYEISPSKDKEHDQKIIEQMEANQEASVMIDDTLNRIEKPEGDLKPMEKGVIDNAVQYMEEKLPSGVLPPERQKVVEANIRAGSTLGYLQATLIRAMSGTAASESEVQRLQKVMQGNDWNQPDKLAIALDEFRDGLKKRQTIKRGQLRISPDDAYNLSQMDADVLGGEEAKTVTRKGKIADGRTVIQYSDGSTEVQ
jgi:hypothetical protein